MFVLIRPHTDRHAHIDTHTLFMYRMSRARAPRSSRRDDWFPSRYSRSLSLGIFSLPTPLFLLFVCPSRFPLYRGLISLPSPPSHTRPPLPFPPLTSFPTQSPARQYTAAYCSVIYDGEGTGVGGFPIERFAADYNISDVCVRSVLELTSRKWKRP